jgi:hypothetical protein
VEGNAPPGLTKKARSAFVASARCPQQVALIACRAAHSSAVRVRCHFDLMWSQSRAYRHHALRLGAVVGVASATTATRSGVGRGRCRAATTAASSSQSMASGDGDARCARLPGHRYGGAWTTRPMPGSHRLQRGMAAVRSRCCGAVTTSARVGGQTWQASLSIVRRGLPVAVRPTSCPGRVRVVVRPRRRGFPTRRRTPDR